MELKDIKQLIELDHITMQSVKDIHQKKKDILEAIAKEKKAVEKKAWEEAKKQVAESKKALDQKIETDKKNSLESYTRQAEAIESKYDANREKWKEELFKRCIS